MSDTPGFSCSRLRERILLGNPLSRFPRLAIFKPSLSRAEFYEVMRLPLLTLDIIFKPSPSRADGYLSRVNLGSLHGPQ
jgi:hypothetical protein